MQRVFRSSGARPTWWAHWRHNLTIQAHLCRISSTQGQFSSFNLAMFHSHDFVTCIFKILQALWEDCKFIHYVWVRWFCLRNPEIFHSCSIHISLLLHHMIKPSKFSWQNTPLSSHSSPFLGLHWGLTCGTTITAPAFVAMHAWHPAVHQKWFPTPHGPRKPCRPNAPAPAREISAGNS